MHTLTTQYHLPVTERTSHALNERLLFIVKSVEFYGRRFDKQDKSEVYEMLDTLRKRGDKIKHAEWLKKTLKVK